MSTVTRDNAVPQMGLDDALHRLAALAELVDDAAAVADAALETDDTREARRMMAAVARLLHLAGADARRHMGLPEAEAPPA
jgi:hypothetical protein